MTTHYFNYCDNQLRNLERTNSIEVSKIGRNKFYSLTFIDKNRM
jgi:ribosomal protein L15E